MKRRDFLKIPAALALLYIPVAAPKKVYGEDYVPETVQELIEAIESRIPTKTGEGDFVTYALGSRHDSDVIRKRMVLWFWQTFNLRMDHATENSVLIWGQKPQFLKKPYYLYEDDAVELVMRFEITNRRTYALR